MLFIQTEDVLADKKVKISKGWEGCAGQFCVLNWRGLMLCSLSLFIVAQGLQILFGQKSQF